MTLARRLVLAVALTAVCSVTLTGILSIRAASDRVPRAFGMTESRGMGTVAGQRTMAGAVGASEQLLAELRQATLLPAAVALALAAGTGGWIAARGSRPLTRLAAVARRDGAGERAARAAATGPPRSPTWRAPSTSWPTRSRPSRASAAASRAMSHTSCARR